MHDLVTWLPSSSGSDRGGQKLDAPGNTQILQKRSLLSYVLKRNKIPLTR